MAADIRFAGYPSAVVYKGPGKTAVQQLVWGDWLRLKSGRSGDYVEVHARGEEGWVHKDSLQKERLLEIVFVDIGQGDGVLVVTPQDKHMLIDAGYGDNMYRFLRWRYGRFEQPWEFESAVITHPDADHYKGFVHILNDANVSFGTLYHNGIMERTGKNSLGPTTGKGAGRLLSGLVTNMSELQDFLAVKSRWQGKDYPSMLKTALDGSKFRDFRMLSVCDAYMPGYGPGNELVIRVVGPVAQTDSSGTPRLKWINSVGKTKNGHSVVLKLTYRDVSILLGGDLNIPAEHLLLSHHTGLKVPPRDVDARKAIVEAGRKVFGVDVAKACHHGSGDFSSVFLDAINPLVTVISSGDNEPHSHPRADTLGAVGLHSRGVRPLIFSTELARSAKEIVKHPHVLQEQLRTLKNEIAGAPVATATDKRTKARKEKEFEQLVGSIDRSIAVYGAINLRTDGRRVVIAQKMEQARRKDAKWDIYRLEPQGGVLQFVSQYV
jgi:beta-lactamase superfamily II metal-dependent hydrolase